MAGHVQATFVTSQEEYAVPESPISVPTNLDPTGLTIVINNLRQDPGSSIEFNFLINGEYLLDSLKEFLEEKKISLEGLLRIEYVQRQTPPKPEASVLHDDWVGSIDSTDKYILTGCYDNTARILTRKGDTLTVIPAHVSSLRSVCFVPNGSARGCFQFLTASSDQSIRLWQWDPASNAVDCLCECRGHRESVHSVAADATGSQFCSGSFDKMVKLWSTGSGGDVEAIEEREDEEEELKQKRRKIDGSKVSKRVPLLTLAGHKEAVNSVLWVDNSTICSASSDHTIRFWDLNTAQQSNLLQGQKVFFSVSYSELNRQLIAGLSDRHIRLYDPRASDGSIVQTVFTSHKLWVISVAWSHTKEYEFISGSSDCLMKLWDIRSPKVPLYDMKGHEDRLLAVNWSNPQLMLSGGVDNALKIFSYSDHSSS